MTSTIPALCGSITGKPNPFGVKIHEAGYLALNLNYQYVSIGTDELEPIVKSFRALQFRGFGVSMPFKREIIDLLDEVSDEVREIGACNTVVAIGDRLRGHNTDWTGALAALKELSGLAESLNGSTAVIVGAGGVARAIAYGLKRSGCRVFISARNVDAASALIRDLSLSDSTRDHVCTLEDQGRFETNLIVNATPTTEVDGPIDLAKHPRATVLLDVIGHQKITPLAREAANRGLRVAAGWRMRLHQAFRQFELYTGHAAPEQVMTAALESALE